MEQIKTYIIECKEAQISCGLHKCKTIQKVNFIHSFYAESKSSFSFPSSLVTYYLAFYGKLTFHPRDSFIDMKKVFDTVSNPKLLEKCEK